MYSRKSFKPRYKKVRYSNETTAINVTSTIEANNQGTNPVFTNGKKGLILVEPTQLQGTRKAKNMLLSISTVGNTVPLLCAIVYVPQGTEPSDVGFATEASRSGHSLYEPNQNVIMQFVLNPVKSDTNVGSDVQTFKTRLARNLDSGDSIMFVYAPAFASDNQMTVKIAGTFNYAISY